MKNSTVLKDTLLGPDGKYSSRKVSAFWLMVIQSGLIIGFCSLGFYWTQSFRMEPKVFADYIFRILEALGLEILALFGITTSQNIVHKIKGDEVRRPPEQRPVPTVPRYRDSGSDTGKHHESPGD